MEQQITPEYLKQFIYSVLPELLEQYYKDKYGELSVSAPLERFVRVEEELKALRTEISTRFEAQKKDSEAKFEIINARFEALDKRFNFLQWLILFGFTFMSTIIALLNLSK